MKFLAVLLLGLSLTSTPTFARHSLKSGHAMIDYGAVHLDQVVVKIKDDVNFTFTEDGQALSFGTSLLAVEAAPAAYTLSRLFKSLEDEFQADRLAGAPADRLAGYASLDFARALTPDEAKATLAELFDAPEVEFAYFKGISYPATLGAEDPAEQRVFPQSDLASYFTEEFDSEALAPDFQSKQFHLEPAPKGVDAFAGWQQQGGDGKGIHVVDIEWGWQDNHEDFKKPFWLLKEARSQWVNHGTAVWGIIAAKKDGSGVTGIAPGAEMGTGAFTRSPDTYMAVAKRLSQEDVGVIVIEQQMRGPDRGKYCPNEYEQATYDAFKKITSEMGIHIIAAAGNGGSNLDSPAYEGAFDMSKRDSGAVMIGAGAPPAMKHLTRLGFSNYGARLDAMGYGRQVVTTGYGDLHGKGQKGKQYTAKFSGTSSATPVVTGAAVSILGMAKAKGKTISTVNLRKALRETGTKQKGNTDKERIGNLPNIPELINYFDKAGWQ